MSKKITAYFLYPIEDRKGRQTSAQQRRSNRIRGIKAGEVVKQYFSKNSTVPLGVYSYSKFYAAAWNRSYLNLGEAQRIKEGIADKCDVIIIYHWQAPFISGDMDQIIKVAQSERYRAGRNRIPFIWIKDTKLTDLQALERKLKQLIGWHEIDFAREGSCPPHGQDSRITKKYINAELEGIVCA